MDCYSFLNGTASTDSCITKKGIYMVTHGGVKLKWSIVGVSEFTNTIIVCIALGTVDEELLFQTKYTALLII